MKKRTLVILSGGMDSTVLAYVLATSSRHELIGAVSVNYGQRHSRELRGAAITCRKLNIPHHLVDLSTLGQHLSNSALTCGWDTQAPQEVADFKIPLPEGHYAAETMKATVVPNRNMILISLALGVAINNQASVVAYGAHAGDHAIYPDCREEFAEAISRAAGFCDFNPLELLRPFIKESKADIVRRGLDLKVPFEDTHTCYAGERIACGRCGTCVERLEAFDIAMADDPIEYADRSYWREALKANQEGA
jgi:7-cyano-7-deazaguanine synthase